MRGWYAFVCMVNAATRGGGLVWLRRAKVQLFAAVFSLPLLAADFLEQPQIIRHTVGLQQLLIMLCQQGLLGVAGCTHFQRGHLGQIGFGLLRRDRRAQVGGRTSGQVDFLLVFAKSILPHFFAFFQRQFSTKTPRRMHGQNAYTKQKEEHRSAPRCELLQFSPASCRRL